MIGLDHINRASRWPSQTTVYERLGSLSATPRHSPSPMLSAHQPLAQRSSNDYVNSATHSTRFVFPFVSKKMFFGFCKKVSRLFRPGTAKLSKL